MANQAPHGWHFVLAPTSPNLIARLVAACDRCGLVRTSILPNPDFEMHIDLTGDCPGTPQPAERLRTDVKKRPALRDSES